MQEGKEVIKTPKKLRMGQRNPARVVLSNKRSALILNSLGALAQIYIGFYFCVRWIVRWHPK